MSESLSSHNMDRMELANLRQAGDAMQSSLSRVLAWIAAEFPEHRIDSLGYETFMATLEGHSAIATWTEARKASRV
jgi:hypothetical protein